MVERQKCRSFTFRYFRRVHAAQQVSDKESVSLHLTQPAVTSKVEPEVRPDHVRHRHSVQEPAGVQTRVVMLDPEPQKERDAGEDVVRISCRASPNKTLVLMSIRGDTTLSFSTVQHCEF